MSIRRSPVVCITFGVAAFLPRGDLTAQLFKVKDHPRTDIPHPVDHRGAGFARIRALCPSPNQNDRDALMRQEQLLATAADNAGGKVEAWLDLGCVRALLFATDSTRHPELSSEGSAWATEAMRAFGTAPSRRYCFGDTLTSSL
jgi:hypothetical protein